ncbi:MAG: dicarboxylate/amino acid:cation symporter [Alphaproteobacteria bacterium]|nr:dicarboxylate/amino acid:cation symporter [Alphaproteobacteria bacterium]
MKSISFIVLLSLVAGLVAGALVRASGDPTLTSIAGVVEPFGGLWLNTLRMTVVPLVVSLLITAIASVADTAKTGGLVARAIGLFTVLLFFAAIYTTLATNGLLAIWPLDLGAADLFIAGVGDQAVNISEPPTFASWLEGLAPYNPIKAAAEDGMLALVVFSIFFGFAAATLAPEMRAQIVNFFRAVSEAMIKIVHWVLLAGPIGVFALALGVGLHAGFSAAGTLAQYVVIVTGVTAGSTVIAWIIAITLGRQPISRFTSATTPVWAIAASTQSSLASLPAMLEAALRGLQIPPRVADVVLPLAVAIFRFTSPVANLAVCFFIAHLYNLEPSLIQVISAIVVAYAVSIAAVGLPGQVSFIASIAPICLALGVPTEVLGILIAVEVIPDIFRTLGNVTGDLAATSILARNQPREDEGSPAP